MCNTTETTVNLILAESKKKSILNLPFVPEIIIKSIERALFLTKHLIFFELTYTQHFLLYFLVFFNSL